MPPIGQWYAIQVKSKHEKNVTLVLHRLGAEGFLPLANPEPTQRALKNSESPLFPGYTFCKIDWNHGPRLYQIPGFVRVVGAGRTPIPIAEAEIEAIKNIAQARTRCEPYPFGKPGLMVRVVEGPLKGMEGVVEEANNKRVIVSMPLLRRSIAVSVEPDWLETIRAA